MAESIQDNIRQIKEAMQEYVDSMSDVSLAGVTKAEIAAVALIMECCIKSAQRVLTYSKLQEKGEDVERNVIQMATAMFTAVTTPRPVAMSGVVHDVPMRTPHYNL